MLDDILKKGKNLCKKIAKIGAISFPIIFSGCDKENLFEEEKLPENPNNKIIYENVLDITNNVSDISNYDESTGIIEFAEPQNISRDYIIYSGITSKTPYGLLKYVNSVSDQGKKLMTRQAGLEEVIKEGEGKFQGKLYYSDIVSSSSKNLQLKNSQTEHEFHINFNEIIYDQDNNLSTTDDQIRLKGHSDFDILYSTEIKVKDKKLNLNFDTEIIGETEISLEANLNFKENKEINLWRESFKPISFTVGTIPVVIVPKVELNAYIEGNSETDFSLIVQDNFWAEATLSYDSGWDFEKDFSNKFYSELNLESSLSTKLSVGPKFIGALYNIAGPSFETNFYGELNADISANPWWSLDAGLEGKLGFDVGAITKIADINDFKKTVFDYNKELKNAGGPFVYENNPPEAYFLITPDKGTTSTIFEFGSSGSRDIEDGFNLQRRWDWESDGTWDTDYSYEKTQHKQFDKPGLYLTTLEVKDSEGLTDILRQYVLVKEDETKELILQPGPEGKDAWVSLGVWTDCSKFFHHSGEDSLMKVQYSKWGFGCAAQHHRSFLEFDLFELPLNSEIISASLEFYGYGTINSSGIPKINIYKAEEFWKELEIKWENQPKGTFFKEIELIHQGKIEKYACDVTSLVKKWAKGEPNHGFGFSAAENDVSCGIYSSDHSDSKRRPKLVISYSK